MLVFNRSSLQNNEKPWPIDLRDDGDPLQLTGTDEHSCQLIAIIGEHQTARQHPSNVCGIDLHGPLEQILSALFDQIEPPIRIHPAIAGVEQTARRSNLCEIDEWRVVMTLPGNQCLQRSAQVSPQPRT